MSSRTRTSWRSCEVKPRRSAKGWVAIGCRSPGPPWTSWRSSQQPCWTVMSPTRTAQEEVCNSSNPPACVCFLFLSLTRLALFWPLRQVEQHWQTDADPQEELGTFQHHRRSALQLLSLQTCHDHNQHAVQTGLFAAVSIKGCCLEVQENIFFQGGLVRCWSVCLDASRHSGRRQKQAKRDFGLEGWNQSTWNAVILMKSSVPFVTSQRGQMDVWMKGRFYLTVETHAVFLEK